MAKYNPRERKLLGRRERINNWFTYADINDRMKSFSETWGIPLEEVKGEVDYERGYYDEVDPYLELQGSSLETPKEYSKRMEELDKQKVVDKENARLAKIKKAEDELQTYERLKKKFESK